MLVVIMMLAMSTAALAEGSYTITIKSGSSTTEAESETTLYTYYRVFDASILEAGTVDATTGAVTGGKVAYSIPATNNTLATAIDGLSVDSQDLFKVTLSADGSVYVVELNKKSSGGEFTAAEIAGALNTVVNTENALDNGTFAQTTSGGNATQSGLSAGYYLITSSLGTKLAVQTVSDVTINEKNTYPSNTKTDDKETAAYGETVTYTVEVEIPANVAEKEIKVYDTISKGLTLNTVITVSAKAEETIVAPTTAVSFTENSSYSSTDGSKQYIATIAAADVKANAGKTLVLTYTAVVNSDAVVGTPEMNKAHIEYDQYVTVDEQADVTTYGFTLKKIDGANVTGDMNDSAKFNLTALDGAQFSLWTKENSTTDGDTEIKVVAIDTTGNVMQAANVNSEAIAKYRVAQNENEAAQAVNILAGEATIDGLAAGTYYLQEEVAPTGYNKLVGRVAIVVSAATSAEGVDIAVENNTGSALPSTGGIGTTIFYIIGAILVVGAGVILITRKRMGSAK